MLKSDTSDAITQVDGNDEVGPGEALPIGFVVGQKYVIRRLLGMGGNGAVYEGEHNTVGHRVAIKVVHRTLADRRDITARLQREARICGSLRHPHIGQVYDFGTLDDGSAYMVMELQDGRSLADVLSETRLPFAAIIHIARQLLDGLGAAHRFGAVHRDVKPDNVMIVRDQSGDVIVKLVDFGISKSIGKQGEQSVTLEGVVVGSPDYMSPEQLRGEDIDERTDIYSAGVLLYEAITGRLPFEHDKVVDTVTAIMRDPFPPPSELRRDCPPELERVVLKAMARAAEGRYQSADEMTRALAETQSALRASAVNLVYLSESRAPPGTKSGSPRRRTVDSLTLKAIQDQVRAVRRRSRLLGRGAAALVVTVLLAWGSSSLLRAKTPERIVAKTLRDAVPVAKAPMPERARPAAASPRPAVEEAAPVEAPLPVLEPPPPVAAAAPRAAKTRTASVPRRPAMVALLDTEALSETLKRAATAFALGQTGQARELYAQITAVAPAQAEAWRGLGLASSRLGERAVAARAFERYLALRPSAVDASRIRDELEKVR